MEQLYEMDRWKIVLERGRSVILYGRIKDGIGIFELDTI